MDAVLNTQIVSGSGMNSETDIVKDRSSRDLSTPPIDTLIWLLRPSARQHRLGAMPRIRRFVALVGEICVGLVFFCWASMGMDLPRYRVPLLLAVTIGHASQGHAHHLTWTYKT